MNSKIIRYICILKKVKQEIAYQIHAIDELDAQDKELMDAAMSVAKEIAEMYPPSVWASKMVITEGEKEVQDVVDVSDRMRHRGNNEILGGDPNKGEMVRAFLEKRKPVYDLSYFANK